MNKPDKFPQFTTNDDGTPNDTGDAARCVEPSPEKKLIGWEKGEAPARNIMNWLHRLYDQWFRYHDEKIDDYLAFKPTVTDFMATVETTLENHGTSITDLQEVTHGVQAVALNIGGTTSTSFTFEYWKNGRTVIIQWEDKTYDFGSVEGNLNIYPVNSAFNSILVLNPGIYVPTIRAINNNVEVRGSLETPYDTDPLHPLGVKTYPTNGMFTGVCGICAGQIIYIAGS